jgi:hypothetical protein
MEQTHVGQGGFLHHHTGTGFDGIDPQLGNGGLGVGHGVMGWWKNKVELCLGGRL